LRGEEKNGRRMGSVLQRRMGEPPQIQVCQNVEKVKRSEYFPKALYIIIIYIFK
jgi:hypothetical protein